MHTDVLTKLAMAGTLVVPLTLTACGSDRGGGDVFETNSGGVTASAGSDTASTSDGSSASGTASGSGGSDTDTTTSTSGTTSDSSGGSGDIYFDVGDSGDATGNVTDGGTGMGCQYLDILFVVDISGSMMEEKANLNANFPDFVEVLDDYVADPNNGALGYRIGATNSSFQSDGSTTGLDGALFGGTANDDCGTGGTPWLDGPSPTITNDFVCLATNPKACGNSCSDLGKERPLDAITQFTLKDAPGQPNDGFYRGDQSLLVIVTLTDEDDDMQASQSTPASAKMALDTFAKGEERYVVVTVAGPQNMGCTSNFGDATAAPRLHEFTNLAPNSVMGDICAGDLTQALQDALSEIKTSCDELPPPQG